MKGQMSKEEFAILLKAKNIMVDQAHAAIKYLDSCDVATAIDGHYKLYLTAYNAYNTIVSSIILNSMKKYLPKIEEKKTLSDIYCVIASDYIRRDKYSETINLYFEYKALQVNDKKLDYNFDGFMLQILGGNNIYEKYKTYSEKVNSNPCFYEFDAYGIVVFYYNNVIMAYENNDEIFIEENIKLLEEVIISKRHTEYPEKCIYFSELTQILYQNFIAKTDSDYESIMNNYREFLAKYQNDKELQNLRVLSAHVYLLKTFMKFKYYDYVATMLNNRLNLECNLKTKIYIYELLCECYKKTNNERYVETLEILAEINIKFRKELQENLNDGIVNSIKFYETQKSYDKIKKRYEIDHLTGCYTRSVMRQKILELFDKNNQGTIIFIDLDNLKEANDYYNHSYGDEYLRMFVRGVYEILDDDDSLLFRYGGDEFVIAVGSNTPKTAEKIIKKLIKKFKKPMEIYDELIIIEFSAGVALYPDDGDTFENVINRADTAMYEAKKTKTDYIFSNKKINLD